LIAALILALFASGCGTVKTSGTIRTATEQLLLTNAWDSALQKVDFRDLAGVPVYLDTANVTAVDQGWVVSSLRQALLSQGVLLRQKPEQAQWIVEARVGAYGTDQSNWLLGISQTTIPPTVTGMPSGTVPEMPLIKKSDQKGVAKLAMFAYDRGSGKLVWESGTLLAIATAKDVHVLGIGPIRSGTIRDGADLAGIRLPLTADSERRSLPWSRQKSDSNARGATTPSPSPSGSTFLQPSRLFQADVESFAP
jgi:hypothetical protein